MCVVAADRSLWEREGKKSLKKEIAARLCVGDIKVSELLKKLPVSVVNAKTSVRKLIGNMSISRDAEITGSGLLKEGVLRPKLRIWKVYYDPLLVMTRCLQRKHCQDAHQRFLKYVATRNDVSVPPSELWPPFVLPTPLPPHMGDPRWVLGGNVYILYQLWTFILFLVKHN